ncbi:uncharacterized protein LOC123866161 [Maniola jurtina]|uniref:uncharacterized protein LOC123866161 n=1 Tax=Maniola jurtina TaxID=191418 RepID=UPI001E68F976|nr:uncharacterized protein LOC123866161 [Maniola jurtina]
MEFESKIFSSNIIRSSNESKNNLYDILNIVPVQPLQKSIKNTTNDHCDYVPKSDKIYVPKKKTGRKVKTVRNIRNAFERDIYCYLPAELEKQRNILLRKIRYGFSRDEKTKELATNMLKNESPISKSAWQMLMNINPEEHKYASQYILWKGKCIQVNGSKGGQHKFICNHAEQFQKNQKKSVAKTATLNKRRQMLHHSLNIKFKPGPLTKKKYLDASYQKYQCGELELVSLPKTGLEVQTSYGKPIAPVIDTFINKSFFQNDGSITQKWAEFAVSVIGKNENGIPHQDTISGDSCVTFDLNYKCFQNRILMRHSGDIVNQRNLNENLKTSAIKEEDSIINFEVGKVMENVLNAVEISLKQDEMYTGEDEPRVIMTDNTLNTTTHSSHKNKRNGELRRLDVTVITISETSEPSKNTCQNDYCTMGCICDSLNCSYNLKRHCGRMECMFECKCDFSKYKYMNSFDTNECSDIIPDLINLDKTLGQTLAKEEHKFHQTVIVTDEKSILLKSDKRNWKASKKYADFYSDMHLKTERNMPQILSIICPNLDCKNVEPWCMVHNLYKCFCKGKFTETDLDEIKTVENENINTKSIITVTDTSITSDIIEISDEANEYKELTSEVIKSSRLRRARQNLRCDSYNKEDCVSKENDDFYDNSLYSKCARVEPYGGRKYNNAYYNNTNRKISEMEKNDEKLRKRMLSLINYDEDFDSNKRTKSCTNNDEGKNQLSNTKESLPVLKGTSDTTTTSSNTEKDAASTLNELLSSVIEQSHNVTERAKRLPAKTKLVAWLETSYKQYKQCVELGIVKVSLDPPTSGRLCLYSWEFILSRYRERKNYFLISKQRPFRIFMTVDINEPCFDNCTNISDISLSDIDKYPVTVKNLLTNATDSKENFCILCGLAHCWEVIGSVTKVNETQISRPEENRFSLQEENQVSLQEENRVSLQEENRVSLQEENRVSLQEESRMSLQEENQTDQLIIPEEQSSQSNTSYSSYNLENLPVIIDDGTYENLPIIIDDVTHENSPIHIDNSTLDISCNEVLEQNCSGSESKWFVMKVENDFSEIQFFKRGFFVKYESVVQAINVARASGKTVRLSSHKCSTDHKDPQFGIYAIPNTEDCCVFIGPYEKDENLGIEAIKKTQTIETLIPRLRTRGTWITTNKVDDLKVIDNPLLFISPSCLSNDKMVTLDSDSTFYNTNEITSNVRNVVPQLKNTKATTVKQVKPIKIRKTNGFYHLTPNGCLKPIKSPEKNLSNKSLLINRNVGSIQGSLKTYASPRIKLGISTKQNSKQTSKAAVYTKPIAEIAPQIKERSDINIPKVQTRRSESGMFILKPEEINKRLFEKDIIYEQPHTSQQNESIILEIKDELSLDIENFLATTVVRSAPSDEIFVISDDENDSTPSDCSKGDSFKNVWIVCKNVENLGWIAGKKNSGDLSFEFPGFKSSSFYPESEALKKISQIFARKVYLPKHIDLEWQVLESEADIKTREKLDAKFLNPDYILTKKGLRHKYDVIPSLDSLKNVESTQCSEFLEEDKESLEKESLKQKTRIMNDLEETSKTLEEESSFLWDETISKRGQILESFSETSEELRKELAEQLNCIIFNTEE